MMDHKLIFTGEHSLDGPAQNELLLSYQCEVVAEFRFFLADFYFFIFISIYGWTRMEYIAYLYVMCPKKNCFVMFVYRNCFVNVYLFVSDLLS